MAADPIVTAPRTEPRGGLATLVVFVIMIGIVAGGAFAQNAVAGIPAGPVEVARGVMLTPLTEWEFGGRSDDGNTILLSQGSGSLAISVVEPSDAVAGLTALRDEWLASGTVTATEIEPVGGVRVRQPAFRFAYSGTFEEEHAAAVEGEVTGVSGSEVAVLFDGWAGYGEYASVRDEIATMIRDTVIP